MACKVNNFIVDRITRIVGFDSDENVLFAINQATNPSLSVTSDKVDAVDQLGSVIVSFNRSKAAEFSVENAIFDLDLHSVQAGMEGGKVQASDAAKIEVPGFDEIVYSTAEATYKLAHAPIDKALVKLYLLNGDGTFGTAFSNETSAGAKAFACAEDGQLSLPTSGLTAGARIMAVYTYNADGTDGNGAVTVINSAKNFPKTCKLVVEALGVEACSPEVLKFMYIIFPKFRPNSDFDLTFAPDSTMPFSGSAQIDYCDPDKILYKVICPC